MEEFSPSPGDVVLPPMNDGQKRKFSEPSAVITPETGRAAAASRPKRQCTSARSNTYSHDDLYDEDLDYDPLASPNRRRKTSDDNSSGEAPSTRSSKGGSSKKSASKPTATRTKGHKPSSGSSEPKERSIQEAKDDKGDDSCHEGLHPKKQGKAKGLDTKLPPMSNIKSIFADLAGKAMAAGFSEVLRVLGIRPLNVATMCSGTESPILALRCVQESLELEHNKQFKFHHMFSAEIEPFKQAYIERNFQPPILFRDVRELRDATATTAYGSIKEVPGGADILIAGSSCVDFSNLNNKPPKTGESIVTFDAIRAYNRKFRPAIVVLENVKTAPWQKMQAVFEADGYFATFIHVDTKDYYLPQTRNRGYLVAFDDVRVMRAGIDPITLLAEFKSRMEYFRRPASSHALEFLLPQDDPRFQQARRDLESSRQDRKDVDWAKCKTRHSEYRDSTELGVQRPLTLWQNGGTCTPPDHFWIKWTKNQVERIWDVMDMNQLRSVHVGRDPQHVARFWDLSQNIDRESDKRAPGVMGCLTPSGQPYVSTRGGPLLGIEALSVQGLPIDDLLLTRESSRQLQDLAGNAMSSTVVGAAVLSALIVGHEILMHGPKHGGNELVKTNLEKTRLEEIHLQGPYHIERNIDPSLRSSTSQNRVLDLGPCEFPTASALVSSVLPSVRLCECEGSTLLKSTEFFRCRKCLHTACKFCKGNPLHEYEAVIPAESSDRKSFDTCRQQITDILPMRLIIQGLSIKDWDGNLDFKLKGVAAKERYAEFLASIEGSLGEEVRFLAIKRALDWTVVYEGVKSKLELSISLQGVQWSLFAKVDPSEPAQGLTRQILQKPIARMIPRGEAFLDGSWEIQYPQPLEMDLNISGNGTLINCIESRLGLQHPEYQARKVWTNLQIECKSPIAEDLDVDISGQYEYLEKCGTAMYSLYRQKAAVGRFPTFLFVDQDEFGLFNNSSFVFAKEPRRLDRGASRKLLANIGPKFNLWDVPANGTPISVKSNVPRWKPCGQVTLSAFAEQSPTTYFMPTTEPEITIMPGVCKWNYMTALECSADIGKRHGSGNYRITFDQSAWLTERVRRIPALNSWMPINSQHESVECADCVPAKPLIVWRKDEKQKGILRPYEDEISAGEYERKLKARPAPVVKQAWIDENGNARVDILLNVSTLAHRAKAGLGITDSNDKVSYTWRVASSETLLQRPPGARFEIPNTKEWPPFTGDCAFKGGIQLRQEQSRSVAWMFDMDQHGVQAYPQEEVEEVVISEMAWRLDVKAITEHAVFGGILADDVGYGKTASTFALINSTRRLQNPLREARGAISAKATLILVPQNLVGQWSEERKKKFSREECKEIRISGWDDWKGYTVKQILDADLIIMSWHLLLMNSVEPYFKKIQELAACRELPLKSNERAKTDWFQNALSLLETNIEVLKHGDLNGLVRHLDEELNQLHEYDKDCIAFTQSRRADSKTYTSPSTSNLAASSDAERKVRESEMRATRKSRMRKTFTISDDMSAPEKENMKNAILHMFCFERIIIDEAAYLEKENLCLVLALKARSRWILTATPAMERFSEVNFLASLIGVKLGVEDNDKPQTVGRNPTTLTAAEKFESYNERHSVPWHARRIAIAQNFLDTFARKNEAEHAEIKAVEHVVPVVLSPAEQAIYMELFQQLAAQEFIVKRGRTTKAADNDRVMRLNAFAGICKTPQEALLHAGSDFIAPNGEAQGNASRAGDQIVRARGIQKQKVIDELQTLFKHAEWLQQRLTEQYGTENQTPALLASNTRENKYDDIKRLVKNGAWDGSVAAVLAQGIANAHALYDVRHGDSFYVTKPKRAPAKKTTEDDEFGGSDAESEPPDDTEVQVEPDTPNKKGKAKKKKAKPKPKYFPLTVEDTLSELRIVCHSLRNYTNELQEIERGLNFFERIRHFQKLHNAVHPSSGPDLASKCAGCSTQLQHSDANILVTCGHILCQSCLVLERRNGACFQKGCMAKTCDEDAMKVVDLYMPGSGPPPSEDHSSKIGTLIQLLKGETGGSDSIKKEDQVILFVQFDHTKKRVVEALEGSGITYSTVEPPNKKKKNPNADPLESFRNYNKKDKDKDEKVATKKRGSVAGSQVLILDLDSSNAAGLNLTNASHVIFFSPLLAANKQRYLAYMTQAIGRARRYEQKKVVKIWRLLSLKTIDVNIVEDRERKTLVKGPDGYLLVDRDDIQDGEVAGWRGRAVPVDLGDEDDWEED